VECRVLHFLIEGTSAVRCTGIPRFLCFTGNPVVSCNLKSNYTAQLHSHATMAKVRAFLVFSLVLALDALELSRRKLIRDGVVLSSGGVLVFPKAAEAARGAAELDFEYYMRDLVGGNQKVGNILPSPPPDLPPPREVTNPLRDLLLNNACTVDCLTTLALVEVVLSTGPPGPPEDPRQLEKDIEKSVRFYRENSKRSFFSRAPWKEESVSDQYYFDLTSYALWRTAADMLPNFRDRDTFVRKLGRFLYSNALKYELLRSNPIKGSLVGSKGSMTELLDLFTTNGFCHSYRIGESFKKDEDQKPNFDKFDDDAVASGASVDCLVSIFEPATLGASLQITGEQSRFAPDFVGTTLAAMWESAGIQSSWESFFVDPKYRPNPKGESVIAASIPYALFPLGLTSILRLLSE
jgi:hypothetical protein